eukprot:4384846-Ditylum_brightwellii.AAC.1
MGLAGLAKSDKVRQVDLFQGASVSAIVLRRSTTHADSKTDGERELLVIVFDGALAWMFCRDKDFNNDKT